MTTVEAVRHYVDSRQDSPGFLSEIQTLARELRDESVTKRRARMADVSDRVVDIIFYAHSSITIRSFIGAADFLGLDPLPNSIPSQTSWGSEKQLIEVAGLNNSFAVALRSQAVGGAEMATSYSIVPMINAGEGFEDQEQGSNLLYFPQNPTQALTDGFTIVERIGKINDLTFVITGDIRWDHPVVNSWMCSFANFPGARIILATAPFPDTLHKDIEAYLKEKNVSLTRISNLSEVLPETSVLCIAHSQNTHRDNVPTVPRIDENLLQRLPSDAVVIHDMIKGTLPEVAQLVHDDKKLVYRDQVANGKFVRAALLSWLRATKI